MPLMRVELLTFCCFLECIIMIMYLTFFAAFCLFICLLARLLVCFGGRGGGVGGRVGRGRGVVLHMRLSRLFPSGKLQNPTCSTHSAG